MCCSTTFSEGAQFWIILGDLDSISNTGMLGEVIENNATDPLVIVGSLHARARTSVMRPMIEPLAIRTRRRLLQLARFLEYGAVVGGLWCGIFFIVGIATGSRNWVWGFPGFILGFLCVLFRQLVAVVLFRPGQQEQARLEKRWRIGENLRTVSSSMVAQPAVGKYDLAFSRNLARFLLAVALFHGLAHGLAVQGLILTVIGFAMALLLLLWAYLERQSLGRSSRETVYDATPPGQYTVIPELGDKLPKGAYHAWRDFHFGRRMVLVYIVAVFWVTAALTILPLVVDRFAWRALFVDPWKWFGGTAVLFSPLGAFGLAVMYFSSWRLRRWELKRNEKTGEEEKTAKEEKGRVERYYEGWTRPASK